MNKNNRNICKEYLYDALRYYRKNCYDYECECSNNCEWLDETDVDDIIEALNIKFNLEKI